METGIKSFHLWMSNTLKDESICTYKHQQTSQSLSEATAHNTAWQLLLRWWSATAVVSYSSRQNGQKLLQFRCRKSKTMKRFWENVGAGPGFTGRSVTNRQRQTQNLSLALRVLWQMPFDPWSCTGLGDVTPTQLNLT